MNEDKTPSEVYINGDQSTIESLDSSEPLIEHAPPLIEPRNSIISDDDNDYEGIVHPSGFNHSYHSNHSNHSNHYYIHIIASVVKCDERLGIIRP